MTDLPDDAVDAILAGQAHGSAPAEFARVAELARAARVDASGAAPAMSARDLEVIDAIASSVLRGSAPTPTGTPTGNVIPITRRRGRAAGFAVFAAVTLSAATAAAATNHLPSALQDALANAGSHVGVHFPTAAAGGNQPASTPPATGAVPQHDLSRSSASVADHAPPAVTPGLDGTADNSDHQNEPGDIASEAHSDNPATADDGHARSGDYRPSAGRRLSRLH